MRLFEWRRDDDVDVFPSKVCLGESQHVLGSLGVGEKHTGGSSQGRGGSSHKGGSPQEGLITRSPGKQAPTVHTRAEARHTQASSRQTGASGVRPSPATATCAPHQLQPRLPGSPSVPPSYLVHHLHHPPTWFTICTRFCGFMMMMMPLPRPFPPTPLPGSPSARCFENS